MGNSTNQPKPEHLARCADLMDTVRQWVDAHPPEDWNEVGLRVQVFMTLAAQYAVSMARALGESDEWAREVADSSLDSVWGTAVASTPETPSA